MMLRKYNNGFLKKCSHKDDLFIYFKKKLKYKLSFLKKMVFNHLQICLQ